MKTWKVIFCSWVILIIGYSVDAQKINQTFFVNDWAEILAEKQQQLLEKKIKNYQDSTTTQVAIVTLNSLNGENLEELSLGIAKDWGIGQKRRNNGILILVAIKERKVRIEVGKGLTDRISNQEATDIIKNKIQPNFRKKQYYKGLNAAIDEITGLASGKFKKLRWSRMLFVVSLAFVIWLFYFLLSRKYDRPALEVGIGLLGLVGLEVYWGYAHPQSWYVPVLAELGWIGLWVLIWYIRFKINQLKSLKALVKKTTLQLKAKNLEEQFVPSVVQAKWAEWDSRTQKANYKELRSIYEEQRKINYSADKVFSKRPDLNLKLIEKKLLDLAKATISNDLHRQYLEWLQKHLENGLEYFAAQGLANLSSEDQGKIKEYEGIFQSLYLLIQQVLEKQFERQLKAEKYSKTERARTEELVTKILSWALRQKPTRLTEKHLHRIKEINQQLKEIKNNAGEVWGYDYPWLLRQMAKFLQVKFDKKQVTQKQLAPEQLEGILRGKSETIEKFKVWKQLVTQSNVSNTEKLKSKVLADYTEWIATTEEANKTKKLAKFYENYIERPLSMHYIVRKSTSYKLSLGSNNNTYSSTKRKSSGSSYDDYSSGSAGSSWGGGDFGGDGGSGDW